jgi:small subunit ribosomal protein S5
MADELTPDPQLNSQASAEVPVAPAGEVATEGQQQPGGAAGGEGGRRPRGDRGPRGQRGAGEGESDENVVKVYRCATVVKGGRRFSFSALVVVGDRKGRVGIGYGKANEVPSAVEKAGKAARRNMIRIQLVGTTIPHAITAKYGASKVRMIPAGEGTGVIAGASVRAVLELAGVKDVLTKCYGSTSPKNLVRAAFAGLEQLRSREDVANLRAVELTA